MSRTVVHLLRHGEVDNPHRILYGRLPDFHLSAAGRAMAVRAAASLAGRDVTHLVSSPLERARETAASLATTFGLDVDVDARLIESANAFQGKRFALGAGGALRDPRSWWLLRDPRRPSWGEPYDDIARRVLAAVASARQTARGHEAVCISHQLPIYVARLALQGHRLWHNPRTRQCGLASITSFSYEDDELVAIGYAEPAGPTPGSVPGG